ncbi:MAG: hypothetical protein JSU01_20845 [Bacteroidetes bacterium]|nr:hypothetical protein [Bacteroidota bacterium]
MREIEPPFEIESEGVTIAVTEHSIHGSRVFRLAFPDQRKPLVITVGERPGGEKFWTSTPQGRQFEAEKFGKLIANFIRNKRKD